MSNEQNTQETVLEPAAITPPNPPVTPPQAPAKPPRVRRVGTVTMGVCLILTGLAIVAVFIMPTFDITLLLKLSPLVLVALGVEVLIGSMRGEKLKYDILSMFMCFLLICGALAAACVPLAMQYFGPEREGAESRIGQEWYDNIYANLAGNADVSRVNTEVYLNGVRNPEDMKTLADVISEDFLRIDVVLSGAYADKDAFLKACAPIVKAVRAGGAEPDDVSIHTPHDKEEISYSLNLEGRYQLEKDVMTQADRVQEERYDAQDGVYCTAQELERLNKERAAEAAVTAAQEANDAA
ncbi:MAG: hypothetical protein RSC58_06115 [Ruthenibacterium sp.]